MVGIKTCEPRIRRFGLHKFGQYGIEESAHVEMIQLLRNPNHKANVKRVMNYFARKWPLKFMMLTGRRLAVNVETTNSKHEYALDPKAFLLFKE